MSGTAEGRMEIVGLSSIIIMNLRVGLKIFFERCREHIRKEGAFIDKRTGLDCVDIIN